jgi:hypothetical protein
MDWLRSGPFREIQEIDIFQTGVHRAKTLPGELSA